MASVAEQAIAYHPGETAMYEGDLLVTPGDSNAAGLPYADVIVPADGSLNISMTWDAQSRQTQYLGFFVGHLGKAVVCNVGMELPEQPSLEVMARVLIAAMSAEQ